MKRRQPQPQVIAVPVLPTVIDTVRMKGAALRLDVSVQTIRRWRARQEFVPAIRLGPVGARNSALGFRIRDLEAWQKARECR